MKKGIIILSLMMLSFLVQLIMPFSVARTYDLDLNVGDEVTWETTKYDKEAIEDLVDFGILSDVYLEIDVGFKIKLIIQSIDDTDEGWEVQVDGYSGDNAQTYEGYENMDVYKDPEELADALFGSEVTSLYLIFIPNEAKDYLKEFDDAIPAAYNDNFYVDGLELITNLSATIYEFQEIAEYQENGILKEYTLKYKDDVAYKRELVSVENNRVLMLIIIFIIIGVAIGGVLAIVFYFTRNRGKQKAMRTQLIPQYQPIPPPIYPPQMQIKAPPPTPMPIDLINKEDGNIRYCPVCGAPRQKDAKFCVNCSNKF